MEKGGNKVIASDNKMIRWLQILLTILFNEIASNINTDILRANGVSMYFSPWVALGHTIFDSQNKPIDMIRTRSCC